jgi:aminotransferase
MKSRVAEHIAVLPKSGIRDFFELVNSMGSDVISLGIGEPDFVTPWHVRKSVISAMEKGRTGYTSNLGMLSLREEISIYVEKYYNVKYDPKTECIITVGVSEALDLILRAIITPGDEIIYHEPCYVSYSPEIRMAHGVPVPVVTKEENSFALDPKDFEKAITPKTKAILLNFPCNPTGASLTPENVREIANIAIKHDLIVITDEIYSELTYDGNHVSIASMPGMRERTIFLHGFSKAYAMTGFRMGYACGPAHLIDAMMKIHQYSMLCASIIAQEASIEALQHGRGEMEKMKAEYCRRRNMIVKRLNEIGLKCVMPKGAFYVFPNITSSGLSSKEFATRLLQEEKVAVVPGTAFSEFGEGYVRCAYATSFENIEEAMNRIEKFVKKIK